MVKRFFSIEKDQWNPSNEGKIAWLEGKDNYETYYHPEVGPHGELPAKDAPHETIREFDITDLSQTFKEKLIFDHQLFQRLEGDIKPPIPVKVQKQIHKAKTSKEHIDILYALLLKEKPDVIQEEIGERITFLDAHKDENRRCFILGGDGKHPEMVLCEIKNFTEVCKEHYSDMVAEAL